MKPIIQKLWMVMAMLCLSISASAYDFEVDGIAYTITSLTDLTVSADQLVNKDVTKMTIPESIVYKGKTLTVTSIKDNAFKDNTKLTEISLPNTINSIGDKAFMNNSSLIAIKTPHSLTYLGREVFSGCASITTIHIPEGIEQIPDRTFYGCKALRTIEFNTSVNSIGEYAFSESGLQSIAIPSSVVSIGEGAFYKSGLQSITIPSSVVSLGDGAFSETHLLEINLHDGIKSIPYACFRGCSELQKISFSSESIGSYAFCDCIALQEINLPQSLTHIYDSAFAGCENLKEIAIPSSVIYISPSILWECNNLETLKIGSGLKGLPVKAAHDNHHILYFCLGGKFSAYNHFGEYEKDNDISYLRAVRRFIIEDSDEEFSIRGFYNDYTERAPFTNTDLEYYYVGRPLVAIQEWVVEDDDWRWSVQTQQGTGRINKLEIGGKCTSVPYFYQKIDTLKLGSNIKEFDLNNIYKDDIVKIECLSEVPPTCTGSDFPTKVYTDAILYVPYGSKDAYANAEKWKNFWNIEEVAVESGVFDITDHKNHDTCYHVYDISGYLILKSDNVSEINKLPKGIYIVTNNNRRYKIKI